MQSEWARRLLLLIAGALQPLAFAPFDLYPIAIIALVPLFALWRDATPRAAALYGLFYGLGMFGAGVSWVYVAIHTFGHSNIVIASGLTLLFVLVLAIFPALCGYLVRRSALRWQIPGTFLSVFCQRPEARGSRVRRGGPCPGVLPCLHGRPVTLTPSFP